MGVYIHNEALVLISTVSYLDTQFLPATRLRDKNINPTRDDVRQADLENVPVYQLLTFSPKFKESILITKCKQTVTNNRKQNISTQVTSLFDVFTYDLVFVFHENPKTQIIELESNIHPFKSKINLCCIQGYISYLTENAICIGK
jgi:hypothetical protein